MKRVGVVAKHVSSPQAAYDIIIRNGTIFDGLRTPRFVSDVGIRSGKIATIGRISKQAATGKEVDATGLHICPGFIDLHTHYDGQIFWDPYLTLSGWHGVTSVVIGNCGFGYAPCAPEHRVRAMQTLERNEAIPYEAQEKGLPWDWESFPEFLDSVERTPKGINILAYMGLAPLMTHVMGLENAKKRGANTEEMAEMKRLLMEGMEAGACGFSAQILGNTSIQRDYDGSPMVTDTMSKEDLYAFGSVLAELNRGVIQVAGPSIKTTENLAKASGRPIIYNAVTPTTDQHGQARENHRIILDWIEKANQEKGLRIWGQGITTMFKDPAFQFSLQDNFNFFDSSRAWLDLLIGTAEERAAKMRDPAKRQACREQVDKHEGPNAKKMRDGTADGGLGISRLVFQKTNGKESLEQYVGKDLTEIAAMRNQHVVDAFLDMNLEEDLKNHWTTEPRPTNVVELKKVANGPYCVPGVSDGGAHTKFITLGDYSTDFLAEFVRDHDGMNLEDAHWKLSAYCAQAAGIHDRGSIAVGMAADVLVYDYKNLKSLPEEIVYDQPGGEWRRIRRSEGYICTVVNGEVTFRGMECTGATPGKLLRHGKAS